MSLVSPEQSSTLTSLTLDEVFTEELYDDTSLVFAEKTRSITTIVRVGSNILLWLIKGKQ